MTRHAFPLTILDATGAVREVVPFTTWRRRHRPRVRVLLTDADGVLEIQELDVVSARRAAARDRRRVDRKELA